MESRGFFGGRTAHGAPTRVARARADDAPRRMGGFWPTCKTSKFEPVFSQMVKLLFTLEGVLLGGSVIDAGAAHQQDHITRSLPRRRCILSLSQHCRC